MAHDVPAMKFLGVDFGWMRGASGVALLEAHEAGESA
jgi:hypothetical protein